MSTPERRRREIEALHAQSSIGQEFRKLTDALGNTLDKDTVIRTASRVLRSDPVDTDGKVRIGNFEFDCDVNDNLQSLSNWTDGIVIKSESPDRR